MKILLAVTGVNDWKKGVKNMKPCGCFFPHRFLLLVVVFSSLLFVADLAAQKGNPGSQQPLDLTAPSFSCGVCPSDFTALNGAGWNLCWRQQAQQGLVIRHVCFKNQRVLFQMTQPFVLVPYHGNPPSPTFKDGLNPQCGGVAYVELPGTTVAAVSSDDDNPGYPAAGFPAGPPYFKAEVASTYAAGNYRYRQRYIFHGTGEVEVLLGLGGFLLPGFEDVSHFHSQYWRLDFDLDDFTANFVEEFSHLSLRVPDLSELLDFEGARRGDPSSFTKWLVRSNTRNAQNEFHSWDIEPIAKVGATYEFGTAEVWPVVFHPGEEGEVVGTTGPPCSDAELETVYSTPAERINPNDIVVWVATHHHHEPRPRGEEDPRMPGFMWTGITLLPRNFLDSTPEPER
jgi:hypothetical protein